MTSNPKYIPSEDDVVEMTRRFSFIPKAEADQIDRYQEIRKTAMEFALFLMQTCPKGRELSLALTHLEETVLWSINSIARNEGKFNLR